MRPHEQGTRGDRSVSRRVLTRALCIVAPMLLSAPAGVWAQWAISPLHIHTPDEIRDASGDLLPGNAHTDADTSAMVQILATDGGIIHPPLMDPHGMPDDRNPILAITRIGNMVTPVLEQPSRFSYSLDGKAIDKDESFFVRIFNCPDPTKRPVAFYGDSQVFTNISDSRIVYAVRLAQTARPVDPISDTDGDGLPDWWEYLHFDGDITAGDPDKDYTDKGQTALEDFIAGTDPWDPNSYFHIVSIEPVFSEEYDEHVWTNTDPDSIGYGQVFTQRIHTLEGELLRWPSVEGRVYRVEYTTNMVTAAYRQLPGAEWLPATPDFNTFISTNVVGAVGSVYYRVFVKQEEE